MTASGRCCNAGLRWGGEIYIHGGGADHDWTAGCIAPSDENLAKLFALCQEGDRGEINR